MAKRGRPHPKRTPAKNFVLEWREWRDYTQEDVCDRLFTMFGAELTPSTLSRMERGESALDTGWMKMLAEVLRCEMSDLIARPPQAAPGLFEIWSRIEEKNKEHALKVLETFARSKDHDNAA